MSEFETIHFEAINCEGVYFGVEENELLIDFEEKLRTFDYVFVEKRLAKEMFDKRSKFESFARKRGFVTRWDSFQYCFVCNKEPPWIE